MAPYHESGETPARIDAAFRFIEMMNNRERGWNNGMCEVAGTALSKKEHAARDAAIELVRNYFTGEIEFAVQPPRYGPDDDDPRIPGVVPIPAPVS